MSNGVLVVQLKCPIKNKDYENLHRMLVTEKALGVVLLPPYCEAIYVPEDVEIKLEKKED